MPAPLPAATSVQAASETVGSDNTVGTEATRAFANASDLPRLGSPTSTADRHRCMTMIGVDANWIDGYSGKRERQSGKNESYANLIARRPRRAERSPEPIEVNAK